jgi:hypothetical protein
MSIKVGPPPRVERAAERADLGAFSLQHHRRTPRWRLLAELLLWLAPIVLLLAARTGRPDGAWAWLPLPVGLAAMGVALWRIKPLMTEGQVPPRAALRDLGRLALYAALIGGYLAWQWRLGWPDGSFGDRLRLIGVLAAAPVAVIAFDVLFLAYAPWYTFDRGLVLGNTWGGRRRVVRYADVTGLWHSAWTSTWLDDRLADLGAREQEAHVDHHWHRLRIRRSWGLRFTSSADVGSDNLSSAVCDGVALDQVDGAEATVTGGGTVRFGPITAALDGVRSGSVFVPWSSIRYMVYSDRKLEVVTTDGTPGLVVRARRVRNGLTLQSLYYRMQRRQDTGKRRGRSARRTG